MARPTKQGLDYFALDVKLDDESELIEATHGPKGFAVLIKMFMRIYSQGYYVDWNEKEQLLFSKKVNVPVEETRAIVDDCIKWEIFDKSIYDKYNVLTSRRIQDHFVHSVYKRTQVTMQSEYTLITVPDRINLVSDIRNSDAVEKQTSESTHSIGEYSKENNVQIDTDYFNEFWSNYPKKRNKQEAKKKFLARINHKKSDERATADEMIRGAKYYNDHIKREGTEDRFIQHPKTFLNQRTFDDYQEPMKGNVLQFEKPAKVGEDPNLNYITKEEIEAELELDRKNEERRQREQEQAGG
ncbi:DUF4373 domain-containing protein [Salicibibacter halophilus]|uniref:DUF4373 domain-containing protein n=1 Tax=Salicibibacter halophilus TaxID=2502791 RepID=A0A514LEI4_9BACI|nr:DUF4373 domain-containing protein [Salicibibacter halophilus]QDI90239.1 DUF4373 domain-containing protein [Salicibibacter halophilus]